MGVIPAIAAEMEQSAAKLGGSLRTAVLAEIPAFSASGNPDVLPGLAQHVERHVHELCRLFSGGEVKDFAFVADHARARAEQRFPLELTLQAYRCGHRVLLQWLSARVAGLVHDNPQSAVSAVTAFAIDYVNTISARVTSAYVDHTRRLAESEGDARKELLRFLLAGYDESDGRVAGLLKRNGYLDQRQAYAVVAVLPVNAAEMENMPRVQRLLSALTDTFAATPFRVLAGVRDGFAVAVVSNRRRQSGWTAAQSPVSGRVVLPLTMLGPSVLVGISTDHPSTAFIPKAFQEARVALSLARIDRRVVQFADLSIRDRLVERGMDNVQSAPPSWAADLASANEKSNGSLVLTLRALAAADLNVQSAARQLGKHPNTIYARIERISQVTGQDPRRYDGLTELLLAADCQRLRSS